MGKKQKVLDGKSNIQKSPMWFQNIQHDISYYKLNCKGDEIY